MHNGDGTHRVGVHHGYRVHLTGKRYFTDSKMYKNGKGNDGDDDEMTKNANCRPVASPPVKLL